MSQVGEAFVVVRPLVQDFRGQLATAVDRAVGTVAVPIPVSPAIPRGSTVTWERLATGASIPKVVPMPVQPTITPAAKAAFAGEVGGIRGALLGAGQFGASRALGISGVAAGLFAFAIAGTKAVKSAATLEQELNVFQATSGATADQMARVREQARKLGADIQLPAVSAGDAAATMTELAKAGLSVNEVLAGTRGTLQLATAANIDFASAAEISANALNAFHLPGTDAVKVADLLAGAAKSAQGEIGDFGLGLSQVASVANQAGLSIQETVTFLTQFAKAGIAGSDSGTSFRVALLRLIAPTKEASDIFAALNVDLQGFQSGRIRAPEFFEQLKRATAGLTRETRNAALATIFGTDAIRVINEAVNGAGASYQRLAADTSAAGLAQEQADARTKGLSGSISGLSSNLETLGADLGTVVLPLLTKLTDEASKGIAAFDKLAVKVIGTANKIAAIDLGPFGTIGDLVKDNVENAVTAPFQPLHAGIDVMRGDFRGAAEDVERLVPGLKELRRAVGLVADAPKIPSPIIEAPGGDALSRLITGSFERSGEDISHSASAVAARAGKAVGDSFAKNVEKAITDEEQGVIDAARRTVENAQRALRDVVAEGARAVEASAVSAKQNLASIGQTLATQVVDILDSGPLAQRINALQKALDASRDSLQQGSLRRSLREAQQELERAENQVAGARSPLEVAGRERFLQPFRDKVADATAALQEFNQQGNIDKLTARLEAQKTRIQRVFTDIIAKFNAGILSSPQVNARVAALLQKNVGPMATAGKAQGFAFRQAFAAEVAALQAQVAAIVGGPQTRRTGAEPDIVSPAAAAAQARGNVRDAQRGVREAVLSLKKAQTDALTGPGDSVTGLLKQIHDDLKPKPAKPSADVKTPRKPARTGGR